MSWRIGRIVRRAVGCAITTCLLSGGESASAQDDPFVTQHDAEAAKYASSGFSISFAGEHRTFHAGETIPLTFTFRRYDVSSYHDEHCPGLGITDPVLDHADGTTDPHADLWNNGILDSDCGLLGGVRGGIVGADGKPQFQVNFPQAVRFDHPGTYRFYARSRPRFPGMKGDRDLPPLISNILVFTIVDRDPVWEERIFKESIQTLTSSPDGNVRRDAARTIGSLGTSDAVDEMARRLYRNAHWDGPADDSLLDWDWLRGLYGSRDRAQVVRRLEQELDRPDRYVSPAFVAQLSLLESTRRTNTRPIARPAYESLVHSYSTRHLAALKAAGGLRKDLEQSLAFVAKHELQIGSYALAPGFVDFPDDVEAAFVTLTPVQQRQFLSVKRNWTVLADAAFVPMLRRLAVGADRRGPQTVALRLLYVLDPVEGRRIALQELAKPDSEVDISGVGVIPDTQLPDLEHVFIRSLDRARTPEQYAAAMDRIERFATGRLQTRVRRAYLRFKDARSCRLAPAALAYFFRVSPRYAQAEIDNVLAYVYAGDRCDTGVLPAIAERRMMPAIEESAITHLGDANAWVAADAASMLRDHGSRRAEAPLWDALERWHERWRGQAARLEQAAQSPQGRTWEQYNGAHLTTALMTGTGWLLTSSALERLVSLCVTGACQEWVRDGYLASGSGSSITVYPSALPGGEPSFFVKDVRFAHLSSRAALDRWLSARLEPATFTLDRTEFITVDEVWLPGEADRLADETRTLLATRGMTLVVQN